MKIKERNYFKALYKNAKKYSMRLDPKLNISAATFMGRLMKEKQKHSA